MQMITTAQNEAMLVFDLFKTPPYLNQYNGAQIPKAAEPVKALMFSQHIAYFIGHLDP